MPSFVHARLSEGDMRDLIAWLRTVPPTGTHHPAIVWGPQAAQARAAGMTDAAAQAIKLRTRVPVEAGSRHAAGRYWAQIACAECHGPDLKGPRGAGPGDPPDLAVTASYSTAELARLLRTGKRRDGTPAGFMAEEGPKRLRALSDAEVAAIREYLVARAAR